MANINWDTNVKRKAVPLCPYGGIIQRCRGLIGKSGTAFRFTSVPPDVEAFLISNTANQIFPAKHALLQTRG